MNESFVGCPGSHVGFALSVSVGRRWRGGVDILRMSLVHIADWSCILHSRMRQSPLSKHQILVKAGNSVTTSLSSSRHQLAALPGRPFMNKFHDAPAHSEASRATEAERRVYVGFQ